MCRDCWTYLCAPGCTFEIPHRGGCVVSPPLVGDTYAEALKNSQNFEEPLVMLTDEEMSFEADAKAVYDDALALLLKKHSDYGKRNVSDSPGGALNGLRVRLHDKFARINNLVDNGATPENEPLRDSFLDAMNYCAIALMVLDEKWQ